MERKVLFLDRDGVINEEIGNYVWRLEDLQINFGLVESLADLKRIGVDFVVITNQGGIAKGLYTMEDVRAVHQKIQAELGRHEIEILDFFVSPHHDLISNSLDRKPKSLMIERALHRYKVKAENALMIGDKDSDVQAANSAGIKGLKIKANSDLRGLNLSQYFL